MDKATNKVSRFQKFVIERVHRSSLKNASYNPRSIDQHAKRKLRENLRKNGLIQAIIWNKRSGNIVGGHRRIDALDTLECSPDYWLDVAVVDLDDKTEKEQNVFLNNAAAQGSFDLDLLGNLKRENNLDAEAMGFDNTEFQIMFDDPILAPAFAEENDPATKEVEAVEAIRARKKEWQQKKDKERDSHNYGVLMFDSTAELTAFLRMAGFDPGSKYIDGRKAARMMGLDVDKMVADAAKA